MEPREKPRGPSPSPPSEAGGEGRGEEVPWQLRPTSFWFSLVSSEGMWAEAEGAAGIEAEFEFPGQTHQGMMELGTNEGG